MNIRKIRNPKPEILNNFEFSMQSPMDLDIRI
jgi:hypothetical protein